jgi:hypothetical protein
MRDGVGVLLLSLWRLWALKKAERWMEKRLGKWEGP